MSIVFPSYNKIKYVTAEGWTEYFLNIYFTVLLPRVKFL